MKKYTKYDIVRADGCVRILMPTQYVVSSLFAGLRILIPISERIRCIMVATDGVREKSNNRRRIMNAKVKTVRSPRSLETTLLKVERVQGLIYCLIELRIFEDTAYCISISGEEFSAELIGENMSDAERLFDLVQSEGVPPYQLFDIVSDRKREAMRSAQ